MRGSYLYWRGRLSMWWHKDDFHSYVFRQMVRIARGWQAKGRSHYFCQQKALQATQKYLSDSPSLRTIVDLVLRHPEIPEQEWVNQFKSTREHHELHKTQRNLLEGG